MHCIYMKIWYDIFFWIVFKTVTHIEMLDVYGTLAAEQDIADIWSMDVHPTPRVSLGMFDHPSSKFLG